MWNVISKIVKASEDVKWNECIEKKNIYILLLYILIIMDKFNDIATSDEESTIN